MCGLSCFVRLSSKNKSPNKEINNWSIDFPSSNAVSESVDRLERSAESMRHRGPDAKGIWVPPDNRVGLGHVRLSTRDLSEAGTQPLHSVVREAEKVEDIHVVVNGEIYYPESLRASLAEEYEFQSSSDSEMVIPLYKRFGPTFVQHLRGEFALALYDGVKDILVAARDRFGVKPLYYGVFDGELMLASQIKGIKELLPKDTTLRWDVKCLAQGGGHYGGRTMFEGIRKFPQGSYLVVEVGAQRGLDFRQYWNAQYPSNEGSSDARPEDELIAGLRERLVEAVRLWLEATDTQVGILLSGGVDSSAVAGMASMLWREKQSQGREQRFKPPTCFTIRFPNEGALDESSVAQRTAEHLSLPCDAVTITEQDLANDLEETCWLGEVPMWDLQHVAKAILSRHVSSQGIKVVLNGDGSDELFAGYPFFVAGRLEADDKRRAQNLQRTTSAQRERLRDEYIANIAWFGVERSEGISEKPESELSAALQLPETYRKLGLARYDDWLLDEVLEMSDPHEAMAEEFTQAERDQMAAYHPLHRSLLAFNKTVLPNMVIAAISDGAEMAHWVESRPSMLDHVVAEFAHTLPVDMLVRLDGDESPTEKWIFREAVKHFIPEEVYKKRKHAFAAPFRYEVGGPLYVKLSSIITDENIRRLGFVDPQKSKGLLDRAFVKKDQLLFRKAIWLAQVIILGDRFDVETWKASRKAQSCVSL